MIDLPLAPLADALAFARDHLPGADNLGRSGDERDAYAVIEELAQGVRAAYPRSRCAAGCSACCAQHKALFRIFESEWETLHDHILEHWSEERIAAFAERFWREAGPLLPALEAIQARMDRGERVRPEFAELPIDCPFLEGGRCSVYPARAAICRGFGYFHLRPDDGGDLEIYACNMQRAVLRERPAGDIRAGLPVFNTVYAQVEAICTGESKRLIPLWIARTFPAPGGFSAMRAGG
ncbi:MAG: YkgJ family cysteine cluster protein [Candidatus Sericytochromatia bacterium]|nr:YkgJ family cysteine cluster protein [Candidatus Tanganyikabacteria bacterium]